MGVQSNSAIFGPLLLGCDAEVSCAPQVDDDGRIDSGRNEADLGQFVERETAKYFVMHFGWKRIHFVLMKMADNK